MNSENPDLDHEEEEEEEALRLKTLAETKFNSSDLNSALDYITKAHSLSPSLAGVNEMLTSFTILYQAAASSWGFPNYYSILQVQPFSHLDTIKKQYKKLALTLHPDKNPNLGSEEAFKVVTEGFRVLSDRVRRKEYDLKLRIRLQEESAVGGGGGGLEEEERFSTVCSDCRLVHKFEKKFLGHSLVCPNCRKSFRAVEVKEWDGDRSNDGGGGDGDMSGDGDRVKNKNGGLRGRKSGVELAELGEKMGSEERVENVKLKEKVVADHESVGEKASLNGGGEWSGGRLRGKMNKVRELMEILYKKRVNVGDDKMTLAEMQSAVKRKASSEKVKLKEKEREKPKDAEKKAKQKVQRKDAEEKGREKEKVEKKGKEIEIAVENGPKEKGKHNERKKVSGKDMRKHYLDVERQNELSRNMQLDVDMRSSVKRSLICLESERQGISGKNKILEVEKHGSKRKKVGSMGDRMVVPVHTDFYDFRKEITERSFKKGQVWAIYDEVDGFPRHYGVINDVIATYPFVLRLSWLELQESGYQEKTGLHVGSGIFKVSREALVKSMNIFSHLVDCERAAREIYRIYPKKGSVWAVYKEGDGSDGSIRDRHSYDLVVFLTTYSDMHVLSFGYLEKVDGFKATFKRREIGCHAVKYLKSDELQICSHQIPAKKLIGNEDPKLVEECWELDPASLPSDLLSF